MDDRNQNGWIDKYDGVHLLLILSITSISHFFHLTDIITLVLICIYGIIAYAFMERKGPVELLKFVILCTLVIGINYFFY